MYVMISYDIGSDRRRRKLHAMLSDYGRWIQYSLFECRLTAKQLAALRTRMAAVISEDGEDRILICDLCADCVEGIEQLGLPAREELPEGAIVW